MEGRKEFLAKVFVRNNADLIAAKIIAGEREVFFDSSTYEEGCEEYISKMLMPIPEIDVLCFTDEGLRITFI